MTSALKLQVVVREEDSQPEFMHIEVLGEGESLAHEPADTLPGRAEEAFGVAGLPSLFGAAAVRACWKHRFIRKPKVAACRSAEVVRRQSSSQPAGALLRAVAEHVGDHLAGASAERDPEPALAFFLAAHKAPELIEFQHVAFSGGQQRLLKPGKRLGLFFPPSAATCDSRGQRRARHRARKAARWWPHGEFSLARLGCRVAA